MVISYITKYSQSRRIGVASLLEVFENPMGKLRADKGTLAVRGNRLIDANTLRVLARGMDGSRAEVLDGRVQGGTW